MIYFMNIMINKLYSYLLFNNFIKEASSLKDAALPEAYLSLISTPNEVTVELKTKNSEQAFGKTVAEKVGYHFGSEFYNYIGKDLWHQHRDVAPELRGLGFAKDMLVALHQEIKLLDGVCISYGAVTNDAIENNLKKLRGFKLTPIIIIDIGVTKMIFPADEQKILNELMSLGFNISNKNKEELNYAIKTGISGYYNNKKATSIKSGFMIELVDASCDLEIVRD